jgi:hypothetical protein
MLALYDADDVNHNPPQAVAEAIRARWIAAMITDPRVSE